MFDGVPGQARYAVNITPINLFLLVSAVWRLSSLLANEKGPFYMFQTIRRHAAILEKRNKFIHNLHLYEGVSCEWCNSVWFSSVSVLCWCILGDVVLLILMPLAISTWTIIIKYVVHTLERSAES